MNILRAKRINPEDDLNLTGPIPLNEIKEDNWSFDVKITAAFKVYHDGNSIHLRYQVNESNIRAVHKGINLPVYEDSCVEFFISIEDGFYYNFEFNCIGSVLGGYGESRGNRTMIDPELLKMIRTNPSLGRNRIQVFDRNTDWQLDIRLPLEVFCHSEIQTFSGIPTRANFYKCGDLLESPHYLSWNPVESKQPDFHRPECFGHLIFD